jgi:hypothetical protein
MVGHIVPNSKEHRRHHNAAVGITLVITTLSIASEFLVTANPVREGNVAAQPAIATFLRELPTFLDFVRLVVVLYMTVSPVNSVQGRDVT